MKVLATFALAFLIFLSWASDFATATPPRDSCIACHAELEGKQSEPAKKFDSDIHHQAGLSCADCHGGDPADESMNAMSRAKGFRGAPKKAQIPDFCARCHSDIAYMHRFNPRCAPTNSANTSPASTASG